MFIILLQLCVSTYTWVFNIKHFKFRHKPIKINQKKTLFADYSSGSYDFINNNLFGFEYFLLSLRLANI